jgi:hypothetical protein
MDDKPKPINVRSTGKVTVRETPDGQLLSSSAQDISLHIETIKSIGIENLADVEVHAINNVFNSVSHYIRFFGGGEVRFSYNAEGRLLEFVATNVAAHIANGERILLKRKPETGL